MFGRSDVADGAAPVEDYLLYCGLFAAILITQVGTRRPDAKRLLLPVVIVAAVGAGT